MRYVFPPKPLLITRTQALFQRLDDDKDVIAELKLNGTRLLLHRYADGHYEYWNRHHAQLKYHPSNTLVEHLNQLRWPAGNCLVDGELMHFKTTNVKHTIVLFDVFIWDGKFLSNETLRERKQILDDLFGEQVFGDLINSELYLCDYQRLYDTYTVRSEVEGLVMKRLSSKLQIGFTSSPIVSWMWKVRKPGPTYRF
jgi:ATP-dependent DNA ligase